MGAEILAGIADDADTVNGGIEIEAELNAFEGRSEGSVTDSAGYAGGGVDGLEAAGAAKSIEDSVRGPEVDAQDIFAGGKPADHLSAFNKTGGVRVELEQQAVRVEGVGRFGHQRHGGQGGDGGEGE